jgi:CelD/BcsL family acetyltransferase involved in cellulose biosynthesis
MEQEPLLVRSHHQLATLPETEEWNALWTRCCGSPFQHPDWVTAWLEIFSPPELIVVEVRRDHELVGLAPLCCFEREGEMRLVCAGAYTSDYLDWLIDPRFRNEVLAGIFEEFRRYGQTGREIDMTDLSPRSALWTGKFPEWVHSQRESCNTCPVISIPATHDDGMNIIPARQRRNLRTAEHRTREVGSAEMVHASDDSLPELMDALFRLHQRRWTRDGQPGVLSDQDACHFHTRVSRSFLNREMLRLFGMRLNGTIIAVVYGFAAHETLYCYLQGFDPAFVRLSPGAQVLGYMLKHAVDSGNRAVDLLRGKEAYKYEWGAQDQQTYRLRISFQRASSNIEFLRPTKAA